MSSYMGAIVLLVSILLCVFLFDTMRYSTHPFIYPLIKQFSTQNESSCYLTPDELNTTGLHWNQTSQRFWYSIPTSRASYRWFYGIKDELTLGLSDEDAGNYVRSWGGGFVPLNYVLTQDNVLRIYPTGRIFEHYDGPQSISAQQEKLYHSCLVHGAPVMAAGQLIFGKNDTIYWDNFSGHYRPDPTSLLSLLQWIQTRTHPHLWPLPEVSPPLSASSAGVDGDGDKQKHMFRMYSKSLCNFLFCTHKYFQVNETEL